MTYLHELTDELYISTSDHLYEQTENINTAN